MAQGIKIGLRGTFGYLLGMLFISPFFQGIHPKKGVFKFTTPIRPCLPSNLCRHILHATILLILNSKTWGFGFKARGLRDTCHQRLIFQIYRKIRTEDSRFKLTLSLNLRVNIRLGGYSIWSASLIAPHIKKTGQTTRGMSTSQPRCSQENTRRTLSRQSSGQFEDTFKSTRTPAVLGTLLLGYRMGHGPRPTSVVTTRNAVELLVQ
jgi:hypothetical protein